MSDSSKTTAISAGSDFKPNNPQYATTDLFALLLRLLEKWHIIAISAILCAVLFLVYTVNIIKPKYTATSKLYVVSASDSVINLSDLQISNYLAKDYIEVFDNWHVHENVMQRLNLNYTYRRLSGMVSVTNPANTRILEISVTSTDPEEAQLLAKTYAEVAREFITVKMETAEPTIFQEPLLPTSPTSPNKRKNMIMGFLLGMLAAAGIITVMYLRDDYIRTAEDVETYLKIPVLGTMMLQDESDDEPQPRKKSKGKKRSKKNDR